jgi:hypothetical protein
MDTCHERRRPTRLIFCGRNQKTKQRLDEILFEEGGEVKVDGDRKDGKVDQESGDMGMK